MSKVGVSLFFFDFSWNVLCKYKKKGLCSSLRGWLMTQNKYLSEEEKTLKRNHTFFNTSIKADRNVIDLFKGLNWVNLSSMQMGINN